MKIYQKIIRFFLTLSCWIFMIYVFMWVHEFGHMIAIIGTQNIFCGFKIYPSRGLATCGVIINGGDQARQYISLMGSVFACYVVFFVIIISYLKQNYTFFLGGSLVIWHNLFYWILSPTRYIHGDGNKFMVLFENPNYELYYIVLISMMISWQLLTTIGLYKIFKKKYWVYLY